MEAVRLDHVTYQYPTSPEPVLWDLSLSVPKGGICAVIGNNGSGKTTCCNVIRGFAPYLYGGELSGSVKIMGRELKDMSSGELAAHVGFIFQNPFTQGSGIRETVFEEIAFGLENLGIAKEEMIRKTEEVIRLLEIEELSFRKPTGLSGGQRQRVAIASILVMDPEVIIMDEPTSQLDPAGTSEIFELMRLLKSRGKTVILVEHKMDFVVEYADTVICMEAGKIIAEGMPREVFADGFLIERNVTVPQAVRLGFQMRARGWIWGRYRLPCGRHENASRLI